MYLLQKETEVLTQRANDPDAFDMHGLLAYMGACHTRLQESFLGSYPGVGTFHSCGKSAPLGAYLGVGTYTGDYGSY